MSDVLSIVVLGAALLLDVTAVVVFSGWLAGTAYRALMRRRA
jgi:hypothetical protein